MYKRQIPRSVPGSPIGTAWSGEPSGARPAVSRVSTIPRPDPARAAPIETAGKRLDQVDETVEERHGDVELTYGATEPTNKK